MDDRHDLTGVGLLKPVESSVSLEGVHSCYHVLPCKVEEMVSEEE